MNNYWLTDESTAVIQEPGDFAEGADVIALMQGIVYQCKGAQSVLDYGCGKGRLCRVFTPSEYVGYDPNGAAIAIAMREFPEYKFTTERPPLNGTGKSDLLFCYTSLLHHSDYDLRGLAQAVTCPWVIVAEVMGRDWRREGNPPVYNRESIEYVTEFCANGYALYSKHTFPHERYSLHNKRSTDITVLVFRRAL